MTTTNAYGNCNNRTVMETTTRKTQEAAPQKKKTFFKIYILSGAENRSGAV